MSAASHTPSRLLPPPAATILLYAADGLSVWKKSLGPKGFPRMPARAIWVPMFRELVNSEEGMRTLHSLTTAGMLAWRCPADHLISLKSAFRDITLRALLIASLDDYADTGFVRVLMPLPPARPQAPAPTSRPESPQRMPYGPRRSSPHRPGAKPKGPSFRPG